MPISKQGPFTRQIAIVSVVIVVLMLSGSIIISVDNIAAGETEFPHVENAPVSNAGSNSVQPKSPFQSDIGSSESTWKINGPSWNYSTFPQSVQFQPYTDIQKNQTTRFNLTNTGPTGISFGVMNSTLNLSLYVSGVLSYSVNVTGKSTNYVVIKGGDSYRYLNLNISGEAYILVKNVGTNIGQFAFNCYDYYISGYTASLIMYPAQFGLPITPGDIPSGNVTGISASVTVPVFTEPEPFSTQINGGFSSSNGTSIWFAQVGLATLEYEGIKSLSVYPVWETFSSIYGSIGGVDRNYPMTPGEIYNLSIVLVKNSTWEFAINGLPITYNGFTGYYNATGSMNNINYGLETEPHSGPTVNMTSEMRVPSMFSVRVNGVWTIPGSASFTGIGENWYNGNTTGAKGISLWGMAGHLQNSSIPNGTLLFQDNLSASVESAIPISGEYCDPIYGNFYVSPKDHGNYSPYLTVKNRTLEVRAGSSEEILSLISYSSPSGKVIQDTNYILNPHQNITYFDNNTYLLAAASDLNYNLIYEYIVNETPKRYNVTFAESGLVPGTKWTVTLNGNNSSSNSNQIVFTELNGTYNYSTSTGNKLFGPNPANGTFTVNGSSVRVTITFTEVQLDLVFNETGLPSGTRWSVTVNGTTESSTSSSITFIATPGTYVYLIRPPSGYAASPLSGTVRVANSSTSIQVAFSKEVTDGYFTGSVSPANATIYINGQSYSESNGRFNISLPPGSYQVKIEAPGYPTYTTNITISSSAVTLLQLHSITKSTTPTSLPFANELIFAIVAILIVSCAVIILRRRRV